ncbi:MAG TPA: thioesterase family protein [Dehalococcoidia bacterium]|nr:thioesterase family protein [Dehalococcoidia bacterium]
MTNIPDAFFEPDGDQFLPTPHARGPWDPNSLHGRVIGGLLGRTFEQRYGDETLQFARLTVDLFRLPPMAPLQIETQMVREGRRIRVVDGVVSSNGTEIARGRGVLLRRTGQPAGEVWSPPNWDVPPPEAIEDSEGFFSGIWETRAIRRTEQKRTWLRETRLLIAGEALTPFVRCAVAADFANPFANSGSAGLSFVNADITLYLHRLPAGEWLGFEVASHQSSDGISVGETTLYDVQGAIGKSIVCGVANQRRR